MMRDMLNTHTASHRFKKHLSVGRRVVAGPITALRILAITQGELLSSPAKRVRATALQEAVREFLLRVDGSPLGGRPRQRSTEPREPPPDARAGRLCRWTR